MVHYLYTPPSSNTSTKPHSPRSTEPNKSTEHSAIQKDSDQCAVGAVGISCLLSTIWHCGDFDHSIRTISICLSCLANCKDLSLLKLVSEPDSLLLEDQKSLASSEVQSILILMIHELSSSYYYYHPKTSTVATMDQ